MISNIAVSELESTHKRLYRPVSVVIPTYGAAHLLVRCLLSLREHLPEECAVYVVDDATPDRSIEEACQSIPAGALKLYYIRRDENSGFVETCNWAWKNCWTSGTDLLLLNSDTEVTSGFLTEMQGVLHLHERHAAVSPRSNNATIFSLPWTGDRLAPEQSFEIWRDMRPHLPRYHMVPTIVGFCALIKGEILEEFGLFDPIYSPGYNEENDFICRVNRCGYSAVAANHAFVFHYESSSFGARRRSLDKARRGILVSRYPEYDRKVADYFQYGVNPPEYFAELYAPHRPKLLFDVSHLPAKHSGTSEFALNLLRELYAIGESRGYDLFVGLDSAQRFFINELRGYRIYQYNSPVPMLFDLVFKPCQLFTWQEFRRMSNVSPRVTYTLQDIIGVRCDYLNSADRTILFREVARYSDLVFSISKYSRSDFNAMYGTDIPMHIIQHGTNFRPVDRANSGDYVLVVGNSFAHKGLNAAIASLQEDFSLLVLGKLTGNTHPNVKSLESGQVSRRRIWELFVNARAIVYPSYYEGFGLPIIDALALNIPVIARQSEVNGEVARNLDARNLHLYSSTEALSAVLAHALTNPATGRSDSIRTWSDAAHEYHAAFADLLAQEIDIPKLTARTELLRLLDSRSAIG